MTNHISGFDDDHLPPSVQDRCIVLMGIRRDDLEFLTKWFTSLAEMQRLLKQALEIPTFKDDVVLSNAGVFPDFGITSSMLISELVCVSNSICFAPAIINLETTDTGIDLALLAQVGLIERYGFGYKLSIPAVMTLERLQKSGALLGQSLDEHYVIHPELFLHTLSSAEAKSLRHQIIELGSKDAANDNSLRIKPCIGSRPEPSNYPFQRGTKKKRHNDSSTEYPAVH